MSDSIQRVNLCPKRKMWQALSIIALMATVIGGCGRSNAVSSNAQESRQDGGRLVSEEEARRALVELVEQSRHEALRMSLTNLKTDPVKRVDAHRIQIGQWHVDLKDATFVVSVIAPPVFEEYRGNFTRKPKGDWEARIESERRS